MSRIECGKYKCLKEGTQLCGRRTPGEPESCICKDGYIGDECVDKTCPGTPIPCSGHGACNGTKCKCDPNWYGAACEIYCDRNGTCSGHGTCGGSPGIHRNVPEDRLGTCYCDPPWFGETCNQKPVDPPNACEAMGNCGTGGGYVYTNEYRELEYINDPIFHGTDNIDWRTDPPTSKCLCNCQSGYYRDVKDPTNHYYSSEWRWGSVHPYDSSLKAPEFGLSNTGISTDTDTNGKCLPCPPGYYVDTIKDGVFIGKTVCKRCSCPSVSAGKGKTTSQHFAKKSTNEPLATSQVCSGSGTSSSGDPDLLEALNAKCIPHEIWCDNTKCHTKKSDAPCSLANRNCPAYYTDYGTGNDMCFPGWSVRDCVYNH
jgi:hypothetical protein